MKLSDIANPIIKEDWGSSDQTAMNRSIHKGLGSPSSFPSLDRVLDAAESAVSFYWDDWQEYKSDRGRTDLINTAARRYYMSYFPKEYRNFLDFFKSR